MEEREGEGMPMPPPPTEDTPPPMRYNLEPSETMSVLSTFVRRRAAANS